MHPDFGPISAYSVFLILGVFIGTIVSAIGARNLGLRLRTSALSLVTLTVFALVGAKLFGLIESWGSNESLRNQLFTYYRYPGGIVAAAVGLWVLDYWKVVPTRKLADIVAPSCAFAMSVVRIGCLLAGCCAGKVSTVPWAIRFPAHSTVWMVQQNAGLLNWDAKQSLPVHPLQIYFGLLSFSLGWFCLWLQRHKRFDGEVFLFYVTIYGIGQFLLEFLRLQPLPQLQLASLTIGLGGALLLVARTIRPVPIRGVT